MEKPGLTSACAWCFRLLGRAFDRDAETCPDLLRPLAGARRSDAWGWRCVRGACGQHACDDAYGEEQEIDACENSSPYDAICGAVP